MRHSLHRSPSPLSLQDRNPTLPERGAEKARVSHPRWRMEIKIEGVGP